jgi:flagellar motor protein MotB
MSNLETKQGTKSTSGLFTVGVLQRKCDCGQHTIAGGQCAECTKTKRLGLQTKLNVNEPGDVYEQEADHIADQVMAAPTYPQFRGTPLRIQRFAGQLNGQMNSAPDSIARTLASSGRPLDLVLQQDMERRFGHDFSQVRVHSGAAAAQSASDVNAQAYTVGHNVVFGAGRFAPGTQQGRRLIAHELTHVVQQATSPSSTIQRQPEEEEEPASDFGKELKKDSLFQELEKAARDKILKEIDKAPETITKAVFDKIIDLAAIDQQYKDGLKKVGEAIIKIITNRKSPSTSKCDALPEYHEGGSSLYKGMCCRGSTESAEACCPKDKFAPRNGGSNCCTADEFVSAAGKCEKPAAIDIGTLCVTPGKRDTFGKCCMPPFKVIDGMCVNPVKPEPPPQPFSLKFTVGVIDDYNIDESILNGRQKPHFEKLKQQIHQFMEACPSSMITIVGFADKPGSEEHNFGLGQRRADHVKFLLQLDLIKINFRGMSPLIFARSEGENNPVDPAAGEKFSGKNRRIEIEFNSICPPLGNPSLTKPLIDTPLRMRTMHHSALGEL